MRITRSRLNSIYFSLLGAVSIAIVSLMWPSPTPSLQSSGTDVRASTTQINKQNGLSFVEYTISAYQPEAIEQALAESRAVGADWIMIVVNQYQYDVHSTLIYPTIKTARDADLRVAVERAHDLGLSVSLKPHVDIQSSDLWRGHINHGTNEDAWSAWFESYRRFINHYAILAAESGIEQLVVGTELRGTSGREREWRTVIADVRQRFDGLLTYSANHSGEEEAIVWWDALDAIGISAYYPLILEPTQTPSTDAFVAAWQPYITALDALANRWNKPIIFTEIGYRSTTDSYKEPWCHTCGSGIDQQVQAAAYEAFYRTVYEQPWMSGMYWWGWNVTVAQSGPCDGGYSPYNKPAENVIRSNSSVSVRTINSDCNSAPTATPTSIIPTETPPPPTTLQATNFVLVDDFDSNREGLLNGQNEWQALGDVRVIDEPLSIRSHDSTNQILKARGENALASRKLPFDIVTNGSSGGVGTLHFRVLRDGPVDGSTGASDDVSPLYFPSFEAQFAVQSGAPETFRVRDGDNFASLNGIFAANQWYCVWLTSDLASQRYEIHVSGGDFPRQTRLVADTHHEFAFRNGAVDALRTFFVRLGWDLGHSLYLDDIYVDGALSNLTSPIASCDATEEAPPPTPTGLLSPEPVQTSVTPQATPTATSSQSSGPTGTSTPTVEMVPTAQSSSSPTPASTQPSSASAEFQSYLPIVE